MNTTLGEKKYYGDSLQEIIHGGGKLSIKNTFKESD
jgi:hypothetical protein